MTTLAHRVVWIWMNEFASISIDDASSEHSTSHEETNELQIGDLVTLTIVDVFETDNQGKLLSYCPTFDNRSIRRTNQTAETIRKSSKNLFSIFGRVQRVVARSEVNRKASQQLSKIGVMQHARTVAENVKHKVDEAVQQLNSSPRKGVPILQKQTMPNKMTNSQKLERALSTAADGAKVKENQNAPQE